MGPGYGPIPAWFDWPAAPIRPNDDPTAPSDTNRPPRGYPPPTNVPGIYS